MRRSATFRLEALIVLGLLGAIATGVPSHGHGEGYSVGIESPDHHGHGVQLVDTGPRITVGSSVFVASDGVAVAWIPPVAISTPLGLDERLPRDRSPPPARPRAPPLAL
jgi:hypothetical protein